MPEPGAHISRSPAEHIELDGSLVVSRDLPLYRSPGMTARPFRVKEYKLLAADRIRRWNSDLSPSEVANLVDREFDEAMLTSRKFKKQYEETAPSSTTAPRRWCLPLVEVAAVLQLPQFVWLANRLRACTSGRTATRFLPIAILFAMTIEGLQPEIQATYRRFMEFNWTRAWAYNVPGTRGSSTTYETLKAALNRKRNTPAMLLHANIDLFRRLAGPPDKRGYCSTHPDAGRYLVIDGCWIEANVQQRKGENEEHTALLRGAYELVGFARHTDKDGNETKRCHGYNLVLIGDLATTLPLVWALFPSNVDEKKAALQLLEALFLLWPDSPAEYLVGDRLYDHGRAFAHQLIFKWGVHPVFPKHGGRGDHSCDHAESRGVPVCACGVHMKRASADQVPGFQKRRLWGLPRGQEPKKFDARIRWECFEGRCPNVSTYLHDEPNVYTFLPQEGEHRLRYLREALLVRRNSIEAIFAALQIRGVGGKGVRRSRWANDDRRMQWLIGLALTSMTARRVVHAEGAYEESFVEAERLGLLEPPTLDNRETGPDGLAIAASLEKRPIDASAPTSWIGLAMSDPDEYGA